ncbi:precorrin-2 C(20)-methyltransferase [Photobacterium carnosum]|uniref:precorrin-2 C(20)-methyltransferase n=1 Tax=Photobacterium carnosum TaxID=2023717 RepID=UPI001E43E94D|nr:precorrin-2 C(20)-methyltransferase [Photobacterium carnosum]MCD9523006.1 precorrin-2 C(20)-methyltransferase [Photobacterium carnosum]
MTQTIGKLYAIGVGPGDSSLMTLRSVELLKTIDVIAIPEKNKGQQDSFAWSIVRGAIADKQMQGQRSFLWFPMSKDHTITVPAWQAGAITIAEHLNAGKNVAFITEGDPSVFSTWAYLQEELVEHFDQLEIEIVPGVTSLTAVPAATQIPLCDGEERFCVVPATYGVKMLPELVQEFDTIMLLKSGRMVPELIAVLEPLGLLECATYVSYATDPRQRVFTDLRNVPPEFCYFATVQLSVRGRKGVLRHGGQV